MKASASIKELSSITRAFDQRLNAFAAFVLNATILWDVVCMFRLEKWKASAKDELPDWFEVLSEFDSLVSLGNFAYNHPDFNLPEIQQDPFAMKGIEMGHVLLDPNIRIDNTLELEGDGQYIIITGANMAGKSTFLRTVGTNLVLAMLGAPVCAKQFTFSPLKLHTSVRATDSLQDHESYFYAELVRLKAIVDRLKNGERLFVILDEMLRGTNSRDKQTGSRGFIEQLINLKGMGLVATHDLSLGSLMEEHPERVRNMRFEVDILEDRLEFDYKLKPGISQNLNATFLMKKMGIME
jgi:DNA mismatch repair ATPase MutS